jgi:hypothetical protein
MTTFGSIYKIQFPNGKNYIGLTTTSLEQRQKEHTRCAKKGDTQCLYKALRKYEMIDIFELIEIDTADTLEELCEKEIGYIKEYNSYYMDGNGYNMTYGGEGTNGYVYTEEDNLRISEGRKIYFENNPAARQQISKRMKTYFKDNLDAREKCSEIKKEHYKENPEARQQISEIRKKYFKDNPDAREQLGQKLSEIKKKHYKENPETRQQTSDAMIKYNKENPDFKKKRLDTTGKNKPFDVFTADGTFIKTFTYQFEAIEYLQKKHHITSTIKICEVLAGKRQKTLGFVFKYK